MLSHGCGDKEQFYAAWSRVGPEMLYSGAEIWKVVWIIWFKVDEMRSRLVEMWPWMHVKLYSTCLRRCGFAVKMMWSRKEEVWSLLKMMWSRVEEDMWSRMKDIWSRPGGCGLGKRCSPGLRRRGPGRRRWCWPLLA